MLAFGAPRWRQAGQFTTVIQKSPLFLSPAAGLDEPLDMLHACHARVRRTLGLLARLGEHLAAQGLTAQAEQAIADVLRYFDVAAPLHHEDEELHVFPLLRKTGHAALADALQAEHVQMAGIWQQVRADLQAWQAPDQEAATATALPLMRARWAHFIAFYSRHLQAEEAAAFPEAQRHLAPKARLLMGQDMARRRGARYPEP